MHRYMNCFATVLALGASGCGLINGLQGDGGGSGNASGLSSLSWHGPEQLDHGVSPGSDAPRMVWGQGAAWVAYQAFDHSTNTSSVWVTRRAQGGDFQTPQQLLDESGGPGWDGGAGYPQIAIGDSGDAVVAAEEYVFDSNNIVIDSAIYAARVSTALGAGASIPLVDGAGASAPGLIVGDVNLVADEAGNALLAYYLQGGGIYAVGQPANGSWSSVGRVDNGSGNTSEFWLAAGAAGEALAGWAVYSGSGSSYTLYGSPIDPAAAEPMPSAARTFSVFDNPEILTAMRGQQGMAVIASQSGGLHTFTYDSGSWGAEQIIPDASLSVYVEPALAVNASGAAVLAWRDYLPGSSDSYSGTLQASYWDGGSWSSPEQISQAGANPHAWWASADIDSAGEAIIAWADLEPTGSYTRIYASTAAPGAGGPAWSTPVAIDQESPDAGASSQPQSVRYVTARLAPEGGTAQVTWIQYQSDDQVTPRVWTNWLGQ